MAYIKKEPCPSCGSKDNLAVYEDHKHCFTPGCGHYESLKKDRIVSMNTYRPKKVNEEMQPKGEYSSIPERRISQKICELYRVRVKKNDQGAITHHYYPFNDTGCRLSAYKVRECDTKSFTIEGSFKDTTLFGECVWDKGGKILTITEGEIDCLSMAEVFNGKWAVVSLKNGAQSAKKSLADSYDFIDSFDEIVLAFDNDEAGRKAVEVATEMFSPEKVRVMAYPEGYKDASDMLQAGLVKDLEQRFWKAKGYTPSDVISVAKLKKDWLDRPKQVSQSYPWICLNRLTKGFRQGEMVTITSGTGMGKSSMIRELEYHLLTKTQDKVGIIHLEETPERTIDGLVGLHLNRNYHLDEVRQMTDKDQASAAFDELFIRDGEDVLTLWDGKDMSTEKIISRIRLMAKAQNIKWVVLDHLNLVMSGNAGGDERREIDALMTQLREVVVETNIGLFVVSHLSRQSGSKPHEEGGNISLTHLRGSQGIAQLSNIVIALERNQQSEHPLIRNTTTLRVLKNRYTGETGITGYIQYSNETGRLVEVPEMPEEY